MKSCLVTATRLHFRTMPSKHSHSMELLSAGDVLDFVKKSDDETWFQLRKRDGLEGWAYYKHLKMIEDNRSIPEWMVVARNELGEKERPNLHDHNPRILEYFESTDLTAPYNSKDETHWCSAFVNWCVETAGYEGTDSAWARDWLRWGHKAKTPKLGDIVVFKRGKGGHVGFYIKEEHNKILILGGNQKLNRDAPDQVCFKSFSKFDLLDIRCLQY